MLFSLTVGLDAGQHCQVFDPWPPFAPLSRYSCLRQLGHATLGYHIVGTNLRGSPTFLMGGTTDARRREYPSRAQAGIDAS
jgi:hypothetical protein